MKIRTLLVLFALCSLAAAGANAATIIWDAGGDGVTFADGNNWVGNVAPGNGDEALFDGSVAETAVTLPNIFIQRITVDSAANPNLNITFTLSNAFTLVGTGGYAIDIGAGDAATFTGAFIFQVEDNIRIAGGGSLTFSATLQPQLIDNANDPDMMVGNGATFVVNGTFIIGTAVNSTFDIDSTGGATTVTLNNITLLGALAPADTGGTPTITILGNITWGATGSWDDGSVTTMDVDFDATSGTTILELNQTTGEFDFDQTDVTFLTDADIQSTGGAASLSDEGFLSLTVAAGVTVTFADNLATAALDIGDLIINGTFDVGTNDLIVYEDFTLDAAGVFSQDATTPGTVTFSDNGAPGTIAGDITFLGDVVNDGEVHVVALGSTVTIEGTLLVSGGGFGADEDGGTVTLVGATINYNDDVQVNVADGLILGEGIHTFAADLDLGFTTSAGGVVAWPDLTTNDFECEIHLTGTTVAISAWAGTGSAFAVNSVQANTRVTHVGTLILGWLDVSAATGAGVAWDGSASGDVTLGGAVEAGPAREILTGALDVEFADVTVDEIFSPTGAGSQVDVTFRSTGAGEFFVDSLTIGGDIDDDFGGGTESNGGDITIMDCTFEALTATGIVLTDGANGHMGAELTIENSTVLTDVLSVGDVGGDDIEGSMLEIDNSTITFGASGNFNALDFTETVIIDSTIEATAGSDYAIFIAQQSEFLAIFNSTITGDAAFNISIVLGANQVMLVNNTFEHYDATGVYLDTTSEIIALNGNTFQNGVAAGSHISLNGLGNTTKLNCDQNLFDDSTGTGGDALVTATAATTNRLNFRCLTGDDFGLGAVAITAVQAEARDDDGTSATEVTWEEVPNELAVNPAATQPISLISDTASNQTIALFTLAATGVASTVTDMSFSFDADSTLAGALEDDDIATATLYGDANANGAYDSGEEFGAGTLNETVTGGDITFTVPSEVIAAASTQTWGLAITFNGGAANHYGSISVFCLPVTGLTITNAATTIVTGLPLIFLDVPVTGAVADIVIITGPSDEQEDTAITPAVVVELRDIAGNVVLGRSIDVDVDIQAGGAAGAVLGGTLTVGTSASTGRSTFSDLSIDLAGAAYVLRFNVGAVFEDSAAFDITAAPVAPPKKGGGDGGGCVAASGNGIWAAVAALLAALSLGAVARLRRE
ncbi:MAG: right-handed parallel beta-helix repeat-containing protein [Planctomycetes bacterium]|nr:right-handed parallel beta-helix repeat-containing protein [Planctomycetota bacterium]